MRPRPQGRQFRGISRIGPSLRLTLHANAAVGFPQSPSITCHCSRVPRYARGPRTRDDRCGNRSTVRGGKKPAATDCHAS